jgi:hypothetical protein
MFRAMKANMSKMMAAKKATIKISDGWESGTIKTESEKAAGGPKELEFGDKIYPVINTTLYMDSHDDVHLNGIWNKTIGEQKGKVALILNHDYKIGQVISYPEDVVPMVKIIPWKDLGRKYEGDTEALIFESTLSDDSNEIGFKAYKNGRKVQHSVRMMYEKISLAINSDSEDWKEERKTWEKYLNSIANKERAIELGYFWAVKEARIYKEGSMVLEGSNDVTPTLYEAGSYSTSTSESEKSTQKRLNLLNELLTLSKS